MNDLENWTKVDIMKILISFLPNKEDEQNQSGTIQKATQKDIDMFLG